MPEYEIGLDDVLAAFAKDPAQFVKFILDSADEQTELGGFEPIEELAKQQLAPYLIRGVGGLQGKIKAVRWAAEG